MNGHRRDRLLDLALVLSGVAMMAGLVTLLVPDLLTGPAVMNGSARGTALVLVLGAVPSLVVGVAEARRGAVRGLAVATGATAYLVYNAVLFAFATPFNRAFLVYEATLGLAIFSLVGLGARLWRSTPSLSTPPPRWVAVFLWTIAGLNVLAWLSTIVPALFRTIRGQYSKGRASPPAPCTSRTWLSGFRPSCGWRSGCGVVIRRGSPWRRPLSGSGFSRRSASPSTSGGVTTPTRRRRWLLLPRFRSSGAWP